MQDTFLTVAEIAEHLKVNQQTVRNWIDAGTLKGVRIGSRRVRVRESDLEAFIDRGGDVHPHDHVGPHSVTRSRPSAGAPAYRDELGHALKDGAAALGNGDDAQLVAVLHRVATAADALAAAIDSPHSGTAS
jgi:excisionase family DNA binding protein